jgi:hypothetical protein
MPRVESGSTAFVVLPLRTEGAPVDVLWNGWRPLYRLDGRSPADRDAAHRANVAIRRGDVRAFEAFVAGFVEEARQATAGAGSRSRPRSRTARSLRGRSPAPVRRPPPAWGPTARSCAPSRSAR